MAKLTQILAIEKSTKNRCETEFTKIGQALKKQENLTGFTKTYTPKDEDGERFPNESKKVIFKAQDEMKKVKATLAELYNVIATKDAANCNAKADVVVDGQVIAKDVPAVTLLAIEKKLTDVLTFAKSLPVLDHSENWRPDQGRNIWVTDPVETLKTKKIVKHIVVAGTLTKEHPAIVKDDTEDVTVGSWSTIKFSGAMPPNDVAAFTEKVEKLAKAVKFAREEANMAPAPEKTTGDEVFGYLFG
jgi:hypothetical protein